MRALIVVDVQNDFVTGSLGSEEAVSKIPKISKRIADYVASGDIVVFTKDTHDENYLNTAEGRKLPYPHCIKNTEGWNICKEVYLEDADVLEKPTFGYCGWKKYFDLDKLDSIELIGFCTDICVISNALILKATFPNIDIFVNESCCAGTTTEQHNNAISVMRSCQIEII